MVLSFTRLAARKVAPLAGKAFPQRVSTQALRTTGGVASRFICGGIAKNTCALMPTCACSACRSGGARRFISTPSGSLTQTLDKSFPGALTNADLIEMITGTLGAKGFDTKKTLVATSLCCDEVNRPLETDLSEVFDTNFNMGGLAGFPFGGATSFGAMASHIPDGGDCVVIYGPHVGVDGDGSVGTVERRGKASGGACCGSAVAASGYVAGVHAGGGEAPLPSDALDAQQYFVGSMLLPYAERLDSAAEKMVELPYALYDAQTELMDRIVGQAAGAVAGEGKIAVLGGVQLNTPPGQSDLFLPLRYDLYDNKGSLVEKIAV